MKPVFATTWEIGTTWELRVATSVPRSIQYTEMDPRNKTTSEFRTVFRSPLGVPNSQIPLYWKYLRLDFDLSQILSQTHALISGLNQQDFGVFKNSSDGIQCLSFLHKT